jgi:hypothetical protein
MGIQDFAGFFLRGLGFFKHAYPSTITFSAARMRRSSAAISAGSVIGIVSHRKDGIMRTGLGMFFFFMELPSPRQPHPSR